MTTPTEPECPDAQANSDQPGSQADHRRIVWTAQDLADAYGRSIAWAWGHIRDWLDSGRIEIIGHERLTWARLFDRQQLLDLCQADGLRPRKRASIED